MYSKYCSFLNTFSTPLSSYKPLLFEPFLGEYFEHEKAKPFGLYLPKSFPTSLR
jgi:hypothetical protein